jgi:hypothetical protein
MSRSAPGRAGSKWLLGLVVTAAAAGAGVLLALDHPPAAADPGIDQVAAAQLPGAEAGTEQVHAVCGACHAYPPADTFPRRAWRKELRQAYDFFRESNLRLPLPSLESVVRYYETRAPEELSVRPPAPLGQLSKTFTRRECPLPDQGATPGVTNLALGHLFDRRKLDLIVCDMHGGQVLALKPYEDPPTWHVLGQAYCPCHAEVVDLDGDGIADVLVADLGNLDASNAQLGRVLWLRGAADGSFTPHVLLDQVGRVADVQAADFRGCGKKDLVVAVFGWRTTGSIYYLENQTTDWSQPKFAARVLDARHGAIHVPVADLDGDGRPDFVALFSQEFETVEAFLNEGGGKFRKETIYTAPHPAYGSSGIQLADLNGDGKLDVLYTNGDGMDPPYLLKPYHSVQWLENGGKFPFRHHPLIKMPGAMRAVAADVTGAGRLDILAVSYVPPPTLGGWKGPPLDSVMLLEQTSPGHFAPHALEVGACDHYTCVAGDWNGDGKVRLATGSFALRPTSPVRSGVVLWEKTKTQGK